MASLRERLLKVYSDQRSLVIKLAFELIVVFVGVTAAFALEGVRRDGEEARYRASIIAALLPTLNDLFRHNEVLEREMIPKLAAFDAAIARNEQPALPVFRENGAERPPIRIWDSVIATGAARALEPELLFQLARFYNRQESFGERYVRYATYTEQHIYTKGSNPAAFYDAGGKLRPEYAAYVDRLRDLLAANESLTELAKTVRAELQQRR